MKQLASIILLSVFALVLILSSVVTAYSSTSEVDECYDKHERCNQRVLNGNYGVVKTVLFLTTCDVALTACLIAINI
ncbi:MAG: hypothetical protein GF421_01070 [Candidatus Aminicenantes bacterium]|nr:hypothetical protein [Candidatus Aminicenantes bacterium]